MPDRQARPLHERRCIPCERGTPPMDGTEASRLLPQLNGWAIDESQGHPQLVKTFKASGFAGAMEIANRITPIAEAENHHPDLIVRWGSVTVQLWTHAAGGLTENDFVLAAKLDRALPA